MRIRLETKITLGLYNWELSFDSIRVSKSGKWGTMSNGFVQIGKLAFIWHKTR